MKKIRKFQNFIFETVAIGIIYKKNKKILDYAK